MDDTRRGRIVARGPVAHDAMSGTNYQSGVRLERRAFALLGERGWFVVRSAGSHGVADLVALSPADGHAVLVQCKTARLNHDEWQRLRTVATTYRAVPVIATWSETRRRVLWLVITGDHVAGSHDWPAITYDLGRDRDPAAL